MDVKDINNTVNPALAFGRMSSQSNATVAGQNFAGLLAQAGDMSAELLTSLSGEKKISAPVEKRVSLSKNNGLENVRSDSRAEKSKKESAKVSTVEKKNADKKRKQPTSDENASVNPESKVNAEKNQTQSKERPENEAVAADVNNAQMSDEAVAEASVVEDVVLTDVDFTQTVISGDFASANQALTNDTVAEGEVAEVAAVNPFDAMIKEMSPVENTDAEFEIDLADLQQQPQMKVDVSAESETEKNVASFQKLKEVVDVENSVEQEIVADDGVHAQSAELSEMLGDKQKLKIEVDVKEEKISYLSGQDLVKNRQALNEVLASVETNENEVVSQSLSEQQASFVANNNQNTPVAAFSAFVSGENIALNATSVSEENISVSATQTASAEVINNGLTGAEGGRKSSDVSFRDVYKGMSKEVVEQVKVNITKSAVKGVDTINVRLKPEDLGHIEIKMQIKDGKLQAHIISSRPETAEILQKEAASLEKAFNEAGFQTDGDSLNFSFREDNQANQNKDRNSDLRNFMGEIFENETGGDLDAVAGEYMWNGNRGLNIRV